MEVNKEVNAETNIETDVEADVETNVETDVEANTETNKDIKDYKKRIVKGVTKSDQLVFIILGLVLGSLITASIVIYNSIFKAGSDSLINGYNLAYESEKDAAYNLIKEKYYEIAEDRYHVSNKVSISISEISETAMLEVLAVSDVVYVISNPGDNGTGITSWLEVPGQAVYCVNLQTAEFIIDDDADYVLVRIAYPEITNVTIDYANVNKLLFIDTGFNESYRYGEDLARSQLKSADLLIKKELKTNQRFYDNAQKAAKSTLICLIKQFNPDIDDLEVEVEFY